MDPLGSFQPTDFLGPRPGRAVYQHLGRRRFSNMSFSFFFDAGKKTAQTFMEILVGKFWWKTHCHEKELIGNNEWKKIHSFTRNFSIAFFVKNLLQMDEFRVLSGPVRLRSRWPPFRRPTVCGTGTCGDWWLAGSKKLQRQQQQTETTQTNKLNKFTN